jgi:hypothetical protein
MAKLLHPANHGLSHAEDDSCLVASRGSGVDFGTAFPIHGEHEQANRRTDGGFPVAAWDFGVSLAESSLSDSRNPAENGRENESLPRFKPDKLAAKRALDVWAEFDEKADALGRRDVKSPGESPSILPLEVILLPLTSQTDPLAGWNLPAEDILCISLGNFGMTY